MNKHLCAISGQRSALAARVLALAATAALTATLAGCAMGKMEMSGDAPMTASLNLQGHAFGGQQPVVGAKIQLWAAGSGGYGKGATELTSGHTIMSQSDGSFSVTGDYACSGVTTPVYITATGGNPGYGGTNSSIRLVAALGTCATAQSTAFVWIDEVTTAATAYALAQYSTTSTTGLLATDSIGAPNTTQAQTGLSNAFNTALSMAAISTGVASTTNTQTSSLGTITVTYETTKLNAIADILAACVNTTGASGSTTSPNACDTLFTTVTPTGGTAPTDTYQAAVMMNLNPTSNPTTLFGLIPATPPYTPALAAAPSDWTYGINYSAGTSTTQTLMNGVGDIAADASGNIWVINGSAGSATAESLAEFSPLGLPLANPFNNGNAAPASMASTSPRNMTIDAVGNVIVGSSSGSGYVFEYQPASSTSLSVAVGGQPYTVTADGNNNIWIGLNSTKSSGSMAEFIGSVSGSNIATSNQVTYPFQGGASPNAVLGEYSAFTTNGTFWIAPGTTTNAVFSATGMNGATTCTTFPCTSGNDTSLTVTYTAANTSNFSTTTGATAGPSGDVWFANNGNSTLTHITSNGTATVFGGTTSLSGPRKVAIDGAGNVWVANRTTGVISEFNAAGTPLSPTGSTPGFAHGTGVSGGSSITLDPSGNVWIGNNTGGGATTAPNSIFELVGAGVPTVTPIALALKNGTIGQEP